MYQWQWMQHCSLLSMCKLKSKHTVLLASGDICQICDTVMSKVCITDAIQPVQRNTVINADSHSYTGAQDGRMRFGRHCIEQ